MIKEQAFEIWCLWNSKKIKLFMFEYLMLFVNPTRFQKKYWKLGLQGYWLEFQKRGEK